MLVFRHTCRTDILLTHPAGCVTIHGSNREGPREVCQMSECPPVGTGSAFTSFLFSTPASFQFLCSCVPSCLAESSELRVFLLGICRKCALCGAGILGSVLVNVGSMAPPALSSCVQGFSFRAPGERLAVPGHKHRCVSTLRWGWLGEQTLKRH